MIQRYPCQIVIASVLGILTVKGLCLGKSGLCNYGIWIAAAAIVAAGMCAWIWVRREQTMRKKLRQAAILCLSFGLGAMRMHVVTAEMECTLAGLSDGQEVSVQGRIIKKQCKGMPGQETTASNNQPPYSIRDQGVAWTVFLEDSYLKTSQKTRSCGNVIVCFNQNGKEPVIGNTILFTGKIKFFRTARNEGNFDECSYYQNQGYSFRIYAADDSCQIMNGRKNKIREFLYDCQQQLAQIYIQKLTGQEAGVLSAMLLGEKSMLLDETKELYQRSGIAHILAISGLHISILGAALFRLLRKMGIPCFCAAAVSMGLLLLFSRMTGMGVSTMRAVFMFGLYLGAVCCGRAYDSMNALVAAAVYILLTDPRMLFLAGFQFSFAAVLGVLSGKELCLIFLPKFRLMETVFMSFGIQMLTLPLTAWYYFELPIYSILLNIVVLPFMALVLIFGLSGAGIGLLAAAAFWTNTGMPAGIMQWMQGVIQMLSDGMLSICAFVLRYFSRAGTLCLKLPKAVYVSGQPQVWQIAGYYLIFFVCIWILYLMKQLCMAGKYRKTLALSASLLCLCLLFLRMPVLPEVSILDVGQGDGIYIRTSDGMDVFLDGGSSDVSQVGTYRILPFLKSKGVSGIDYWFLSHLDKDHISGLQEIAESGFAVGQVVLADAVVRDEAFEKMKHILHQNQIGIQYMKKGEVLCGSQARFTALLPEHEAAADDRNARSLVLLYEDTGFCGLFSGDISAAEEAQLLREDSEAFMESMEKRLAQVHLYKAAHHGSGYSNSAKLLRQIHPDISVVSCAKDNDYGHPGKEAVENMEKNSRMVCYTMKEGQIRICWKNGILNVSGYCMYNCY